jgi:hypothetical protein
MDNKLPELVEIWEAFCATCPCGIKLRGGEMDKILVGVAAE